jgi:hypothetical protein
MLQRRGGRHPGRQPALGAPVLHGAAVPEGADQVLPPGPSRPHGHDGILR